MDNPIALVKQQLTQLTELHAAGVLPQAQYEESKAALERRLLDLVLQGTPVPAIPAAATAAVTTPATAPAPSSKTSGRLVAALALGVVVIAGAGYWWKGSPSLYNTSAPVANGVAAQSAGVGGDAAAHDTGADQIAAMVERLAARMKEKPEDAEGWAMLGRSYSVLGRHPEALEAYKKAIALRKDDATLLVDYADSLAVKNNRSLAGEPMKLVERALKLEPRNVKALSLAGTYAFDRKDYAAAVKYWEQVVQYGPPDGGMVQQVQSSLAEARALAGLPAASKPLDAAPAPMAASGGKVTGTVTLAPALRKQAQPDDTVFIFARPAEGSRMPLAIVRKQVKDLPFEFTLDDSMAMSPAAQLSGAAKVIVGARVSKSGNAMPQPGDLSGQSDPVSVGAAGLKIEIKDVVKP